MIKLSGDKMNKIFKNPIILAVDVNSLKMAKSLVSDLKERLEYYLYYQ